jgi:hypothetical protein
MTNNFSYPSVQPYPSVLRQHFRITASTRTRGVCTKAVGRPTPVRAIRRHSDPRKGGVRPSTRSCPSHGFLVFTGLLNCGPVFAERVSPTSLTAGLIISFYLERVSKTIDALE